MPGDEPGSSCNSGQLGRIELHSPVTTGSIRATTVGKFVHRIRQALPRSFPSECCLFDISEGLTLSLCTACHVHRENAAKISCSPITNESGFSGDNSNNIIIIITKQ